MKVGAVGALAGLASIPLAQGPQGYPATPSVRPGATLEFCVSTPTSTFDLTVVRVGRPDRELQRVEGLPGLASPVPRDALERGCRWPVRFRLPIGEWASGLYLARITCSSEAGDSAAQIPFVVRSALPGSRSSILALTPDLDLAWENRFGRSEPRGHPDRASLHRPLDPATAARWQGIAEVLRWLEAAAPHGRGVELASALDLHTDPALLDPYTLVVLVGEHRPWTAEMRERWDRFVRNGGNALVLGGAPGARAVFLERSPEWGIVSRGPAYGPPSLRPPEASFGIAPRHVPRVLPHLLGGGFQPRVGGLEGVSLGPFADPLGGADLEADGGRRIASRASGAPAALQVLAEAALPGGFACVASFHDRGTVLAAGSTGWIAAAAAGPPQLPARGFLEARLGDLAGPRSNLLVNGGFERWRGAEPVGFASSGEIAGVAAEDGGLRVALQGARARLWQHVELPTGPHSLHLVARAWSQGQGWLRLLDGTGPLVELRVPRGGERLLCASVPLPAGTRAVTLLAEEAGPGRLVLDDVHLASGRQLQAICVPLARTEAHSSADGGRIPLARVVGGERYLLWGEARAEGAEGSLAVLLPAPAEPVVERVAPGKAFGPFQLALDLPGRGGSLDLELTLAPGEGGALAVRSLTLFPLRIASPPPPPRILAGTDELVVDPNSEPVHSTRPLAAGPGGVWTLCGWVQGRAHLRVLAGDRELASFPIATVEPVPFDERFELPALGPGEGRITAEVPAGRGFALRAARLRPLDAVLHDDLLPNGAFEMPVPAPFGVPGWTAEGARLTLERESPYRGRASLRIEAPTAGRAVFRVPEHLPLDRPLRLSARVRLSAGASASVRLEVQGADGRPRLLARREIPARDAWQPLKLHHAPDPRPPVRVAHGRLVVELAGGTLLCDDLALEADPQRALGR